MTYEEFRAWVWSLVDRRRLSADQAEDLIRQRQLFDERRAMIESEFAGLFAGFLDDELVVRTGLVPLLTVAVDQYRGARQIYYEPVPAQPAHTAAA